MACTHDKCYAANLSNRGLHPRLERCHSKDRYRTPRGPSIGYFTKSQATPISPTRKNTAAFPDLCNLVHSDQALRLIFAIGATMATEWRTALFDVLLYNAYRTPTKGMP